jgi:hypothetical protein
MHNAHVYKGYGNEVLPNASHDIANYRPFKFHLKMPTESALLVLSHSKYAKFDVLGREVSR